MLRHLVVQMGGCHQIPQTAQYLVPRLPACSCGMLRHLVVQKTLVLRFPASSCGSLRHLVVQLQSGTVRFVTVKVALAAAASMQPRVYHGEVVVDEGAADFTIAFLLALRALPVLAGSVTSAGSAHEALQFFGGVSA